MKYSGFLYGVIALIFVTCTNPKTSKNEALKAEWEGKEILFPENLDFTSLLTDTIENKMYSSQYKILVYTDSLGCTGCKLQLDKWKEFMNEIDSVSKEKVQFLFFFLPGDLAELEFLLRSEEFIYPICLDFDDKLNKINHFPHETAFQTFLLDEDNKVIIAGNPIHDIAKRYSYMDVIMSKDNQTKKIIETTLDISQTEIDLGTIKLSDITEANFQIKNTGKHPLIIIDASSSCGCITTSYDKQPVLSDGTLNVKVTITPKITGFLKETIMVKTNTDFLLKVRVKGNVI